MQSKILVVDDDYAILDSVTLILECNGFEVKPLLDGSGIQEAVDLFKPDLVLTDTVISGIDGRDVCKQIKSRPSSANIPVILFSANDSIGKMARECAADDFISKPFSSRNLLAVIRRHLP